jgi:hypothetical protein
MCRPFQGQLRVHQPTCHVWPTDVLVLAERLLIAGGLAESPGRAISAGTDSTTQSCRKRLAHPRSVTPPTPVFEPPPRAQARPQQAEYINVPVEGPYKLDHYRQ